MNSGMWAVASAMASVVVSAMASAMASAVVSAMASGLTNCYIIFMLILMCSC